MLQLLNAVLREGWCLSFENMIYKVGSQANLLTYQPIALMLVMYKLLSKILTDWISKVVEWENILSIAQGGFHKQRSTCYMGAWKMQGNTAKACTLCMLT